VVLVSVVLFVIGVVAAATRVVTVDPNGFVQVQYPYNFFAGFDLPASIWLMIFGFALWGTRLKPWRWEFLGSGLVASGILGVLYAFLVYGLTSSDEGPRCLDGCAPSLLSYYQETYLTCDVFAVAALVAIGLGVFSLIKKKGPTKIDNRDLRLELK